MIKIPHLRINIKYLFLLILILGFLVRLHKIDNPIADWHSWRQADTASVSKIYVQEGINILIPRYHDVSSIQSGWFNPNGYRFVEFPLFNSLHAIFYKIFPFIGFEIWGRLVSIFSALGSAILVYLISKKYIGELGAFFSAFFYLFLPYNIYFTRVILPDPLSVFMSLLFLYFYILFFDKKRVKFLFISGVFLTFSILVKPNSIFILVPALILTMDKIGLEDIFKNKNRLFIKLLVFLLIVFLPFLIWRIWLNQFYAGIPHMEWLFNGDKIRFHPSFFRWIFYERLTKMILGYCGVILFSMGVLMKKNRIFILPFLLGAFSYVSVFATSNVRHDYYQIFTIPAICMTLGSGVVYLKTKIKSKYIFAPILIFLITLSFFFSYKRIKDFYQVNHPEIIEAGKKVDEITPKDAWVIAPYNGDTAFLYQTNRWGWPAVDDSFEKIIKKGADYYVSVNKVDTDTQYIIKNYEVIFENDRFLIADLHKKKTK